MIERNSSYLGSPILAIAITLDFSTHIGTSTLPFLLPSLCIVLQKQPLSVHRTLYLLFVEQFSVLISAIGHHYDHHLIELFDQSFQVLNAHLSRAEVCRIESVGYFVGYFELVVDFPVDLPVDRTHRSIRLTTIGPI